MYASSEAGKTTDSEHRSSFFRRIIVKKFFVVIALVSALSACGKPEQKNADVIEPAVQSQIKTTALILGEPIVAPVYENKVPIIRPVEVIQVGSVGIESDLVSCSSVSSKKGKLFCKFVPTWYSNSIPSPSGRNEIPFEEIECKSIIVSNSITCEKK